MWLYLTISGYICINSVHRNPLNHQESVSAKPFIKFHLHVLADVHIDNL